MKNSRQEQQIDDLDWGPVKVLAGPHKGRIGYLDDTEGRSGYVYFGTFMLALRSNRIQLRYLAPITTADLMQRHEVLFRVLHMPSNVRPYGDLNDPEEFIDHLLEYSFVQEQLMDRMFTARLAQSSGKKVFISHSSKDKQFATWLSVDLANRGHQPWLDEWKIKAGQSIVKAIANGLDDCDFVIVVLSENSVQSRWVEREWHEKCWDEVSSGRISVIPVLLEECEIPRFLKTKKYADFTGSFNDGLEDVLIALSDSVVDV
ncbi:MAG: toll/interleukin-1 receptor domain-containing protein [Mizugakiibacter sp.]|uniref:toll/interleukin-1 receptor domain-containing protein n=1 Tax=Mizugakiibacter sp. TaxID=1972610 RepID=UPI0031C73164|nr:toll/interleukin-1 receptor domain-containing protein [Xanthomonadaceae bacterium]